MYKLFKSFLVIIIFFYSIIGASSIAYAQTADELRKNIDDKNAQIKQLEDEIASYKNDLNKIASLKKTLNGLVLELDITKKKLEAEINVTSTKVDNTDLKIRQLNSDISRKQSELQSRRSALVESMRLISERDQLSLAEIAVLNDSYSGFWNDLATLDQFNNAVQSNIVVIKEVKTNLEQNQVVRENEKRSLVSLKNELADRKKIAEDNKKKNLQLLVQTKNKESNYTKILNQKIAQKQAFEKELRDYESTLKYILDPTSIPSRGTRVFAYPLDKILVTQQFGKTSSSGRLYASGTHNGTDFAASIGTPVKAVLDGIVTGTGDTDVQKGCYSYGKWVLVKHPNGLSTLYAHFSLVKVTKGQLVSTGELLGYSGSTGYSTGPHLHLTVFASGAVEVVKLGSYKKQKTGCSDMEMPVAATNAYLDPMDYF